MQDNWKRDNIKPIFKILKRLQSEKNLREKELRWLNEFHPEQEREKIRTGAELYIICNIIDWVIKEFAKDEDDKHNSTGKADRQNIGKS